MKPPHVDPQDFKKIMQLLRLEEKNFDAKEIEENMKQMEEHFISLLAHYESEKKEEPLSSTFQQPLPTSSSQETKHVPNPIPIRQQPIVVLPENKNSNTDYSWHELGYIGYLNYYLVLLSQEILKNFSLEPDLGLIYLLWRLVPRSLFSLDEYNNPPPLKNDYINAFYAGYFFLINLEMNRLLPQLSSPIQQSILSISITQITGRFTQSLLNIYQQTIRNALPQYLLENSIRIFPQMASIMSNPSAALNPHRMIYHFFMLFTLLEFPGKLLNNESLSIMKILVNGIYLVPAFPPQQAHYIFSHLTRTLRRGYEFYSQTPLALSPDIQSIHTNRQTTKVVALTTLCLCSQAIVNRAPSILTHIFLTMATAYFPSSALCHDAAYQTIASLANEGIDQLGTTAPTVIQFLINLSLYKLIGEFTQHYLPNFENAYQKLTESYQAVTSYFTEPQLRLKAYWNPEHSYELGWHYMKNDCYAKAIIAYNTVPQQSENYVKSKAYWAACQVSLAMEKLPHCQTSADYAEILKWLQQSKPLLDQYVTFPTTIEKINFFRHVEWQVTHASWLILSGQDPLSGLRELFYLLFARQATLPIVALGHLSPDHIYYPLKSHRTSSLNNLVIPALEKVMTWLEKNGVLTLNHFISLYQEISTVFNQLHEALNDDLTDLQETKKSVTDIFSTALSKLQNVLIIEYLSQTTKTKQAVKRLIHELPINNIENALKMASKYKTEKQWALSYLYYRATVALIQTQYGNPKNLSLRHENYYKIYYRSLFNCALTLEHCSDLMKDSVTKSDMLKRVKIYLQEIVNQAKNVTCTDNINSSLLGKSLSKQAEILLTSLNVQSQQQYLTSNNTFSFNPT